MSESEATRQANDRVPPTSSTTPGEGVTAIAATSTTKNIDLYDSNGISRAGFDDCYITLCADGAKVYINFSAANSVTLDDTVASTSTAAVGTTAAVPMLCPDGVDKEYRINVTDHRYLNIKTASGQTATLRFCRSSQKRVSRA